MQLNFQSYGAGFPVIVLHGLFGSLDNWQTVSRKLGESFRVFAVDLRNHGRSPHSDEFNYAVMAADIIEFMQSQQIQRANLLGHSMGGKVAMHFALQHPALIEKLVVVDMAPRAYPPSHIPIFDALLPLNLGTFRERSEVANALAPAIPSLPMRQFLVKNLRRDDHGALRWKFNLTAIKNSYEQLNAAIPAGKTFSGPVLFVKGGRSEYLGEGDVALIHELFPRTNMKTIPEAGHWVHADAPERLIKIVSHFLR